MKKQNDCPWCSFGFVQDQVSAGEASAYLEFYPENGMFFITVSGKNSCEEPVDEAKEIQFHYCPMCGKKVGYE